MAYKTKQERKILNYLPNNKFNDVLEDGMTTKERTNGRKRERKKKKEKILRLIIAHSKPSVKCIHLELFREHKSKAAPLVTGLTVSLMESEMACSTKSKM